MSLKTCTVCLEEKPVSEYYKHSGGKNRLRALCKPCHNAKSVQWNLRNPEKCQRSYKKYLAKSVAKRRVTRLKLYDLTPEQYDAKLLAQQSVCAICKEPPPPGKVLGVDHNHTTGKNRDLLCHGCNAGIGLLKEDPTRLYGAIEYLSRHAA